MLSLPSHIVSFVVEVSEEFLFSKKRSGGENERII